MTFTLTTQVTVTAKNAEHAEELINKMLDTLGKVPTENIVWDDCDWKELN